MNSQQEKSLFKAWGWEYNFVARVWRAPNGKKLSLDALMDITDEPEGDIALMRLIVQCGKRKV